MRSKLLFVGAGALAMLAPSLPAQTAAPSLLDQPPAAPVIRYAAGKLTIQAANSSLRAILDDLRARTGAKVEGLAGDERIFGVYGPGNPQEVLSALLDDSGYNVVIAGRNADGAPREIVLSARNSAAVGAAPQAQARPADGDEDDGTDQQAPIPQPALFGPSSPGSPGSGPPLGQPANGQQVKSPQQILEELQRLRGSQPPPQ